MLNIEPKAERRNLAFVILSMVSGYFPMLKIFALQKYKKYYFCDPKISYGIIKEIIKIFAEL